MGGGRISRGYGIVTAILSLFILLVDDKIRIAFPELPTTEVQLNGWG